MSRCDCFGFSPATDMKEIYFQELPHHFPGVMSFNWSQWPGFLPSSVAKPSGTHVLWAPLTPQLRWMTHPALPVALVGKSSPLASVISVNVEQGKSNTWAENGQAIQNKSWYTPVFSQLCLLFYLQHCVYSADFGVFHCRSVKPKESCRILAVLKLYRCLLALCERNIAILLTKLFFVLIWKISVALQSIFSSLVIW